MKKYLTVMMVCVSLSGLAQNNMFWYNPYSFYPSMGATAAGSDQIIFQDTSGQVWSASYDQTNSVLHFLNQDASVDDSLALSSFSDGGGFFDKRNWLWIWTDWFWALSTGGQPTLFAPPHFQNSYWWYPVDIDNDNAGNVYFLSRYRLAAHDSSFLIKYDGSIFQSVYLDTLPIPFNNSTVQARYMFCDTNGALYLECKAWGFMKYYQGIWTRLAAQVDTNFYLIMADKWNNFYFQNDTGGIVMKMNNDLLDTIPLPPNYYTLEANGTSFGIGPDGNLWFFTTGNGFYKFDPAYRSWANVASPGFVSEFTCASWPGNSYWPALFDRQGRMWTTGGNMGPPYEIGVYSFIPLNYIKGRVFYDADGNGVVDSGESGFTAMNIVQSTNGYYANTDTTGDYSMTYLDSAYYYTVSAVPPPYYHLTTASNYNASPADSVCCYNFGVHANGNIQDLQITAASYCTRPGMPTYTWLTYQNTGTTPVSDTITYVFDSHLSFVGASPSPTSVLGNKLSWAYPNLQPFQSGSIGIEFLVSGNAGIGDTLNSVATIQPVAMDTTPDNNVYNNMQLVNNSFDPNIKTVSTTYGATPGQELTYTVYFQNTGTAPAINVIIADTLDVNINPASFRLIGSSSAVKVNLSGPGIISFNFLNINLPDSSSGQISSTGFVQFSVNISNPLNQAASAVHNVASIYFDSNSPIETNTVSSSFFGVGITPVVISGTDLSFKLIPNPTLDQLIIKTESIQAETLSIYDVNGQIIYTMPFKPEVDVSKLSSGVYFVEVKSRGLVARKRFVKM